MFHTTRWIYRIKTSIIRSLAGLILLLSLAGCALIEDDNANEKHGPAGRIVVGSYDEIWRAIQKAFSSYPIQVNNLDQGILETDPIKGSQIWNPPYAKSTRPTNYRYVLNVRVVKGKTQGQESAQVLITKRINLQRDFFSNDEELPSDGMEEISLLYRIERELQIERSLRKAFEKNKT